MKLNITNREIFFAVENCWESLPFTFQVQLFNLVKENETQPFILISLLYNILFYSIDYFFNVIFIYLYFKAISVLSAFLYLDLLLFFVVVYDLFRKQIL